MSNPGHAIGPAGAGPGASPAIIATLTVGGLETNCYVLYDSACPGAGVTLIDPGGDYADILRFVDGTGLPLRLVLLTHGHSDHVRALPELLERWPEAEVGVSQEDAPMLADPALNLSVFVGAAVKASPRCLRKLHDGDRLGPGPLTVEVLAAPGHTRGGLCFLVVQPERPVLFSGDTLFAGSVGRTDLPGGSWSRLAESLRRLAGMPPETAVLPGHGPASTIGTELASNPYLREALGPELRGPGGGPAVRRR